MDIQLIEKPDQELVQFFEQRIEEFNQKSWEVKEKFPIAVTVRDAGKNVVGGASAKTFGLWLLVENIWVHESLRGQNIGSKILSELEGGAAKRGCKFILLDTLNFQARPFYERHGYEVQWTQESYPRDGRKFFMTKEI